ncbi:hypothetical protein B9Z19DRAFT_1093816 [Tuber borchii]|uniref:Uncharacterized protein n=1 Tax=Tuber borchii TaxID=42251 RepID=A0A2T6ZF05_TUBBO|nr:hypothetical protein B9Z19DRAFT_1093816 [Tuber borchii]
MGQAKPYIHIVSYKPPTRVSRVVISTNSCSLGNSKHIFGTSIPYIKRAILGRFLLFLFLFFFFILIGMILWFEVPGISFNDGNVTASTAAAATVIISWLLFPSLSDYHPFLKGGKGKEEKWVVLYLRAPFTNYCR